MALDLENIKKRIDQLKNEKAQAEGQMRAIEDTWKRDYGVSTLAEAEALMVKMETELEEARKAQAEYLEAADRLLSEAGV